MKKTAIVITDWRPFVLVCQLAAAKRNKNRIEFVYSSASLMLNDYGDNSSASYKKFLIRILSHFFAVHRVDAKVQSYPSTINQVYAVRSSLISDTSDSMANNIKYLKRNEELIRLYRGSLDVCRFIEEVAYESTTIFNGRLASSAEFEKNPFTNRNLQRVEFPRGGIKYGYFSPPCPIHDLNTLGLLKNKEFEKEISSNKWRGGGDCQKKLKNKFVRYYNDKPQKGYSDVIFLTSSHEFVAINPKYIPQSFQSELDFVVHVLSSLEEANRSYQLAVRCHPNQRNDLSWIERMKPLVEFCNKQNIDFFSPFSSVNSYDLITQAERVHVDLSSIALDSLLLGKKPIVYGSPDYKPFLDSLSFYRNETKVSEKILISSYIDRSSLYFVYRWGLLSFFFYYIFYIANFMEEKVKKSRWWGNGSSNTRDQK